MNVGIWKESLYTLAREKNETVFFSSYQEKKETKL